MENLTAISIFVAVVDEGSFVAASAKLGIARSVVSRRLGLLEAELETRLLHRTTRRVSLTAAGRRFYQRVSEGLNAIREAEREVGALREEPSGKLVASVPMSFGLMHVSPAMPAFRLRYPKVELELRFDDRQNDLVGEGVDVAMRIADLAASSLVARRLAPIRHVVVASASYFAKYGAPQGPSDLAHRECLIYTLRSTPRRWRFKRDGVVDELSISGHFEANNSLALREMLLAGMGVALVPSFLVAHDLANGRLTRVLEEWQTSELELSIVYPTRKHVAPAVRAFIAFMEERIGRPPYWDRNEGTVERSATATWAPDETYWNPPPLLR